MTVAPRDPRDRQLWENPEPFAAVSALLWNEREIVENLLFKLVEEQLVVASGNARWLHKADAEVAQALKQMRTSEVLRSIEVEALSRELDLPLETTLARLAEVAPEPWGLVLLEHRVALRDLVAEVEVRTAELRALLQAGSVALRDTLDRISRSVATYNAQGTAVASRVGALLLDAQA